MRQRQKRRTNNLRYIKTNTFCFYCQREFDTNQRLEAHVFRKHPNTYAAAAFNKANGNHPLDK